LFRWPGRPWPSCWARSWSAKSRSTPAAPARARGITEADLANWGAKYGNPKIFVSLIEWADRVITE